MQVAIIETQTAQILQNLCPMKTEIDLFLTVMILRTIT